jgi:uncharacterized SAM-binding protein YcdF (DUF218 family)
MIFGTYPLPDIMIRYLETRYPPPSLLTQSDAVVVLTGMLDLEASTPDKFEFYDGVERILTGMQLVKDGYGQKLIIAGGSGDLYDQTVSEAKLLKAFAIDFGMPEEQILIDPSSRNTHENAVNTKSLMEQHNISSIILVTTASHLPRAMGCFKKLEVHPIPYGVDYHSPPSLEYHFSNFIPDVGALRKTSSVIHEYIGLLAYKLAGYI